MLIFSNSCYVFELYAKGQSTEIIVSENYVKETYGCYTRFQKEKVVKTDNILKEHMYITIKSGRYNFLSEKYFTQATVKKKYQKISNAEFYSKVKF
jgi:hypothetical protein